MSEYIYLLQEREFIKSGEKIYKLGRTSKENLTRFYQYPKGSELLIQIKCKDSKKIEHLLINFFKENFIHHKKYIGNEYFEGEYKIMIDIIYLTIKNEKYYEESIKDNEKIYVYEESKFIDNSKEIDIYEESKFIENSKEIDILLFSKKC